MWATYKWLTVTWTLYTRPHEECGHEGRLPSAPGSSCRRRRACRFSYNWGGMPGLASPFHLLPASQMGSTKNLEVNYVPFLKASVGPGLKPGPPCPFLSLSFLFSPFLSHSLHMGASYPHALLLQLSFILAPLSPSLTTALQTIIKHLTPSNPLLSGPPFGYVWLIFGARPLHDAWALPAASTTLVICVCNLWGDIRECSGERLKEFISSLAVHREHKKPRSPSVQAVGLHLLIPSRPPPHSPPAPLFFNPCKIWEGRKKEWGKI